MFNKDAKTTLTSRPTVLAAAIGCILAAPTSQAMDLDSLPPEFTSLFDQLPHEPCDPANDGNWPVGYTVIVGTEGNDKIRVPVNDGSHVVYGLGGNDRITGGKSSDILCGGEGNDKLYGREDHDYLSGGDGKDRLFGLAGRDVLLGGDNDDALYGGNDNDSLYGGSGKDRVHGGNGDDRIEGNDGDDFLLGNNGADIITDYSGFDTIHGGSGIDQCSGGELGSCEQELNVLADADADGVPDSDDNCPATPNADQLDNYGEYPGDACEDRDGDDIADIDEENICISVAGVNILQKGTATCSSDPVPGLVAIANGDYARAAACNTYSFSYSAKKIPVCYTEQDAKGESSAIPTSWASAGDVIAEALADFTQAVATDGAGRVDSSIPTAHAIAIGPDASASAIGSNNSASATGESATAYAEGVSNTATSSADNAGTVSFGLNNIAIATGEYSFARANGYDSEATATGENSGARAGSQYASVSYADDGSIFIEFWRWENLGSGFTRVFYPDQRNNIARATVDDALAEAFGGEEGCTAIAPDEDGNLNVTCSVPEVIDEAELPDEGTINDESIAGGVTD